MIKTLLNIVILLTTALSIYLLKERNTFDTRGLSQIDPKVETWRLIDEKRYADADEYLSYFMQFDYVQQDREAVELSEALKEKRESFGYKADKVWEGIISGKSDEDIGKLSAITSDFFVIGDIRDLIIEGKNYLNDDEVDKLIVALSTIGILATASTLYSFGATSSVKSTVSLLKYGEKTKKIPKWLSRVIIKEAKVSKSSRSIENFKSILEPIGSIYNRVGLKRTLNMLKETKNIRELKAIERLSMRFGKRGEQLIKIAGRDVKKIDSLKGVEPKTVIYASSYGEKGLTALKRLGKTKFLARVSKTAYKGNFDSIVAKLLQMLPTYLLIGFAIFGISFFLLQIVRFSRFNAVSIK